MLSRRHFLAAAAAATCLPVSLTFASGQIQHLSGRVTVNGRRIGSDGRIRAGDHVVVAHDSEIEFTLGADAYRLGPLSALTLDGGGDAGIGALRLLTGALLAVFGERRTRLPIRTAFATIGIRGTGVFVAAAPQQVYTCTCYGTTDLVAGPHNEVFSADHHNAHIVDRHSDGTMTMAATKVLGHDDEQLRRLESYVGRTPPFDQA